MPPATRRWLIAIVLAGAALRFIPIWFGLPYPLARPDEETAVGRAVGLMSGDLNPHFFNWPSLTLYVFAIALWVARSLETLLGEARPLTFTDSVVIARCVVALAGTATLVVLFHLGRRVAGERIGVLAALFLAVAILHVRDSHFAMTDVLATLLIVTSLTYLLRAVMTDGALSTGSVRWCAAAGLVGGLAASTKYSAAAIGASMAAAQVLWFWATPRLMLTWRGWMPSAAYGLAMVCGFLAATPYALLDYPAFSRDLVFELTHLSGGHAGITLERGWTYHATHSLPYGVGVPVFIAALGGLVPFVRHYRRAAFVLGGFAGALYLVLGSGQTVFFRYMMPLVPLVCLVAAIGVAHAAGWLSRRMHVRQAVTLVALLAITAGPSVVQSVRFDMVLGRTDTRVLASRWLASRVRPGESLYDSGSDYTRVALRRNAVHRWTYDAAASSFGDPAGRTPDWLVLQESPLPAYASTPPAVKALAQSNYALVHMVRGTGPAGGSAVYDPLDAFFVPVSGFSSIERPGPDIHIYRRRDLPPIAGGRSGAGASGSSPR